MQVIKFYAKLRQLQWIIIKVKFNLSGEKERSDQHRIQAEDCQIYRYIYIYCSYILEEWSTLFKHCANSQCYVMLYVDKKKQKVIIQHLSVQVHLIFDLYWSISLFIFGLINSQTETIDDEKDNEKITNKMKNKNTIIKTFPKSNYRKRGQIDTL